MLQIAIVEDESQNQKQMQKFIAQYAKEKNKEINVTIFSDGEEILKQYDSAYDIILMDIEMPKLNGMEAAKKIREKDSSVVIVFITNMAQYAIDGYSVGALDFVLKPINYYTFSLKLSRAIERVKVREEQVIVLNLPDGIKRIDIAKIHYIDIQNRILHYHTEDGEYQIRGTMQGAEAELSKYHFVKCNHWYLVNLKHVSEIHDNIVTVADKELEISRRNKTAFLTAVTNYVGGNI